MPFAGFNFLSSGSFFEIHTYTHYPQSYAHTPRLSISVFMVIHTFKELSTDL